MKKDTRTKQQRTSRGRRKTATRAEEKKARVAKQDAANRVLRAQFKKLVAQYAEAAKEKPNDTGDLQQGNEAQAEGQADPITAETASQTTSQTASTDIATPQE